MSDFCPPIMNILLRCVALTSDKNKTYKNFKTEFGKKFKNRTLMSMLGNNDY